ncbi:MAG: plasmid mobilization protein [Flavobacteriales bacterium]
MGDKLKNLNPSDFKTVYDYLDATGVLEFGSDFEIDKARAYYWSSYRKVYKKAYRKTNKDVTIKFTLDEFTRLKHDAVESGLSLSQYIRDQVFIEHKRIDLTEFEVFLMDVLVELEDEGLSQDIIVERLDTLLSRLKILQSDVS